MSKRKQSDQPNRKYLSIAAAIGLVLIAGFALLASRPTTSAAKDISPAEYQTEFGAANAKHLLLDVRTPDEFATGHIQGAVNISVETLENHLSEVPRDQPVVIYCRSGNRSAQAAQILAQAGYTDLYDMGGLNDWTALGFPVE